MAVLFLKLCLTFLLVSGLLAGLGAFLDEHYRQAFSKERSILRGHSIGELIVVTMISSFALAIISFVVMLLAFIWG